MQTGTWDTKVKGRSTSELPCSLLEPPENSRSLVGFLLRAFGVSEKDPLGSRKRIFKWLHERFFGTSKKTLKNFKESLWISTRTLLETLLNYLGVSKNRKKNKMKNTFKHPVENFCKRISINFAIKALGPLDFQRRVQKYLDIDTVVYLEPFLNRLFKDSLLRFLRWSFWKLSRRAIGRSIPLLLQTLRLSLSYDISFITS